MNFIIVLKKNLSVFKYSLKFFLFFLVFFQLNFIALSFGQTLQTKNLYGSPGLIDMPTAGSFSDGDLSFSLSKIGPNLRNTIGFQALPRVYGAFRYSGIGDKERMYYRSGYTTWDRSFDLRIDLTKESVWIPDITVGFQDTIGTGLHSAEYIVSSKTLFNRIKATTGLGWGRLASKNIIAKNGIRNNNSGGTFGGLLRTESFFKGNTAIFGGLEYNSPISGLNLKMEFSSDDYSMDEAYTTRSLSSLTNFGMNYKFNENLSSAAYFSSGREVGLQLNISANPSDDTAFKFLEKMPEPFYSFPFPVEEKDLSYLSGIKSDLNSYNIIFIGYKVLHDEFIIIIDNKEYSTHAQAIGRTLRVLSKYVPMKKKIFTVVISNLGLPITQISIDRVEASYLVDAPNAEELTKKISPVISAPVVIFLLCMHSKIVLDR